MPTTMPGFFPVATRRSSIARMSASVGICCDATTDVGSTAATTATMRAPRRSFCVMAMTVGRGSLNLVRGVSARNDETLVVPSLAHNLLPTRQMLRSVTWRLRIITTSAMFVLPPTNVGRPASGRLPDPPGQLIDIGGQRIHLDCTGRGSPTVVFENGAGDFSVVWSL